MGISHILEDEAIGHLVLASLGWKNTEARGAGRVSASKDTSGAPTISNEKISSAPLNSFSESKIATVWRSHASRACWILELLLDEYNENTSTRLISSRFVKLLVIALRTAASSDGDERIVLRLLRIYGRTRQLRGLDGGLPSNVASSEDIDMEYPTDRTCMASIEIAFEKRISQALSSAQDSLGSKRDKGMNNPKGKGVNTITECSPLDQALASLLLMNGGEH